MRAPRGQGAGLWALLALWIGPLALGCGGDREPNAPPPHSAPDPALQEGERLLQAGDFAGAAKALEQAVGRRPGDGRAMLLLGTALHKQKQYALARPWLERAAALNNYERHEGASYFLGWCLLNLGELDAAESAFEAHLKLRPEESDAHFGIGLARWERGDGDGAVERFEQSIALAEKAAQTAPARAADVAKAHARIADVLLAKGDALGARDRLQLALALWPGQTTVAHKLAEVLEELGDQRGADEVRRNADRWRRPAPTPPGSLPAPR